MAKIAREEISQIQTQNGIQQSLHSRSVEDDCPIPSAEELQRFQQIDPRLVEFFMEQSRREQEQRHLIEREGVEIVKHGTRQEYKINSQGLWIMLFVIIVLAVLAAYSLYLGNTYIGGTLAVIDAVALIGVIGNVIQNFGNRNKVKE